MNGQETEVKFYVGDLAKIETKLIELSAELIQPRAHESNMRFDTPDRSLGKEGKVLRLRQDKTAKMTFKSSSTALQEGVLTRKEIEFGIESFEAARELIESLGYEMILFYEKYRKIYKLNDLHVMLDELPYGDFVEIEGKDAESIRGVSKKMGLNGATAIKASYSTLFERVSKNRGLDTSRLTFEAFSAGKPHTNELSVVQAD